MTTIDEQQPLLAGSPQGDRKTSRAEALKQPGVGAAALQIRNAVLGSVDQPVEGAYDPYNNNNTTHAWIVVVSARVCGSPAFAWLQLLTGWVLVLLSFVEPPYWCRTNLVDDDDDDGTGACKTLLGMTSSSDEATFYYPSSHLMWLTIQQSKNIDALCLAIFLVALLFRIGRDALSIERFLRPGEARLHRSVQLACLALLALGLATGVTVHHPYVRVVMLATLTPSAQDELVVLIKLIPEVVRILLIVLIVMVFCAWGGTILFLGTKEGQLYFPSVAESLWTLYVTVTTANYPDVMMPAYNENRWACLYFVFFMVICFFFLMNVVLATIFNRYQDAVLKRQLHERTDRINHLRQAFAFMDPDNTGELSRDTIMALFVLLNTDFPEFQTMNEERKTVLFAILDKDGSSRISLDEFLNFGHVLLLDIVKTTDYTTTLIERRFPSIYHSPWFQRISRIVRSNAFESGIDLLVVLNALVTAIQFSEIMKGYRNTGRSKMADLNPKHFGTSILRCCSSLTPSATDGSIDTPLEIVQALFTIIYSFEVVVKLAVLGRPVYFFSAKNIFDFTITVLAVVATIVVYTPIVSSMQDSRLIRGVILLRVLRLLRLLASNESFQVLGTVSVQILPKARGVVLVLFYLMYCFAAAGSQLFGGLITRDPDNPLARSPVLVGGDYETMNYWANNFNDMFSGINTLFILLIVINWTTCYTTFETLSKHQIVTRVFFTTFYILGSVFVNNLLVALVLDNFLEQMEVMQQDHAKRQLDQEAKHGNWHPCGDGEAVMVDAPGLSTGSDVVLFDGAMVTGTKTHLTGRYLARMGHGVVAFPSARPLDTKSEFFVTEERDNNERLKQLFSGGEKDTVC